MTENARKQLIINPAIMKAAKAIYKGGKYTFSTDSTFIRAVMFDIANGIKKAVKR